jgi:hypothetical protein
MKKLAVFLSALLLAGCLATENRKVEITHRRSDGTVAPVDTAACWWRLPYYADRKDHPMDRFIPAADLPDSQHGIDAIDADLLFFSENAIRWPKKMRPAYRPAPIWTTPAPVKKAKPISLREWLERNAPSPEGEVY